MNDIFSFLDYRLYLKSQIKQNASIRGYQSTLAGAAGCKCSFLSQVLHSHVNLTPDHAAGLCQFWKFDEDGADWFMELVAMARPGSPTLRRLCQRRLDVLKQKRVNLAHRFKPSRMLPKEMRTQYYSSWHWAAIHILTCIPAFNTVSKIANRLQLQDSLVNETLQSLSQMGLVQCKNNSWHVLETDVHIAKSASLNLLNHANWRHQAITRILAGRDDFFHYTAVHALSMKDAEKIREILTSTIEKTREIVKPSAEEELVCLTCDFFKV